MDISKQRRTIQSMFLLWSFVGLGWAVGQEGPSFTDLRMIINKDLDTASWLFTVSAIGNMAGSLVGGILYDRFNKVLMIALSAVAVSVFTGLIPLCKWFSLMMAATLISGFGSGCLDTGVNANIISLWGENGGSYMQALYFCFGIGGILSPIVTEPFLASTVCISTGDNSTRSRLHLNDGFGNTTKGTTCVSSYESTNIHFAYLITFFVLFSSSVPFFIIYMKWSDIDQEVTTQDGSSNLHQENVLPVRQKVVAIIILFSIFLTFSAVQITFFSYLATFCISYLQWSSSTSSYASSVFWITFSAGRLTGIFLVKKLRPVQLLFIFLHFLVLSFIGFLISTLMHSKEFIWLFIALVGLAMSVIFPGVFTWTQENVFEVSGKLSSVFLIAASLGHMLNPLFLGFLMDNVSSIWFVYILLAESCLCLILFLIVYNYSKHCSTLSSVQSVEIMSVRHIESISHNVIV